MSYLEVTMLKPSKLSLFCVDDGLKKEIEEARILVLIFPF